MEELKTKTEHTSGDSSSNEVPYNRRNVDIIKKLIMVTAVILCAIPVVGCIYLIQRLNSVNSRADYLQKEIAAKEESTGELIVATESAGSNDDLLVLDQEAADDIGKNTASQNTILSSPDGSAYTEDKEQATTEDSGTINRKLNGKKVYLTFDDGPSIYTSEILKILDEKNVKATFFVVYNDDIKVRDEYKNIVEHGHTLGMHSYTHIYKTIYKNYDSFKNDVESIHDFLLNETGVDCTYYRFPGGSSNSVTDVDIQQLIKYLNQQGYVYYDWNSLSGDAVDTYLSPEELNANVMKYVRANQGDSVVLMHDLKSNYNTVEALPLLIDTLIEEGYEICPIDENTVPVQHVEYKLED